MKKAVVLLLSLTLVAGFAAAQSANPIIVRATEHAQLDGELYKVTGWGAMAFLASALIPLLGGGAVIIAANLIEPRVEVPAIRMAEAQEEFEETSDILLYQAQYRESMVKPIRKARSRKAWIGTGVGFGVHVILIATIATVAMNGAASPAVPDLYL